MARYMITHSLLYSWLYAMQDNPYGGERDAYQEFCRFCGVSQRPPLRLCRWALILKIW